MPNRSEKNKLIGVALLVSDRATLTSGQAAEVLGFSRWTLLRRLGDGYYSDVGRCKTRSGWLFDMEDIIRVGYPTAGDAEVTMLTKQYREKFLAAKRRKSVETF